MIGKWWSNVRTIILIYIYCELWLWQDVDVVIFNELSPMEILHNTGLLYIIQNIKSKVMEKWHGT